MITKRIIPCLDVRNGQVVKGTNFVGLKEVASPVELAKQYSACGADELVKQFSAFTSSVKASHHMNGQQVITVNGDKAQDVHYCRAALLVEQDGQEIISDNYIRYVDQLVFQNGAWRIAERDQYFVMTESRPVKK